MARQKNTPNDPERRARIVAATMDLLRADGVAAVTARAVAARAEVPVGSVSYHFSSVRELLLEASRRVARLRIDSLEAWAQTVTADTITRRVAELIHEQITGGRALTVIAYELYILGLRDEEFRAISDSITEALADTMAKHLPRAAADHLAATADGLQLSLLVDDHVPAVGRLEDVLRGA